MNIYLTRHGETQWNTQGRVQGSLDSPLTTKGKNDANLLGLRLEKINIDYAYSSSQKRAIDTCKIIMANQDGEIEICENLRELGVGAWEGLTYIEIEEKYPEEYYNYMNHPILYEAKNGGEKLSDLASRLRSFLDDIKHKNFKNILVVTHGLTYMMLINICENKDIYDLSDNSVPKGTSLTKIRYEDDKFEIEFRDDNSHLK